jgi:molybdate transport system substrate-binding protein
MRASLAAFLGAALVSQPAAANEVRVAVASNFERPMQRIAADFEKDTGHQAVVVTGSTGALFAQIENGAPFEVLLAADRATPERLEAEGLAVARSSFVYALGVLVLWSAQSGYVDGAGAVLKTGDFQHLAIANPKLAPYGAAAMEALGALGLLDALRPRLVQGESIAQTHLFVATGNAELGFISLSQIAPPDAPAPGSFWIVPAQLYAPLEQEAALLKKGADNLAARALCGYLSAPKARETMHALGYGLPPEHAPLPSVTVPGHAESREYVGAFRLAVALLVAALVGFARSRMWRRAHDLGSEPGPRK